MSATGIGGFFGLEISVAAGGILESWTGGLPVACFVNARSALAALIAAERPPTVWLPAFLCDALAEAVPEALLQYYPVGVSLTPQVSALGDVRDGDMFVGINYFGYGVAADFIDFAAAHPDVLFVEDCAHCLAPQPAAWGDWRLFSPRKLLGVADGGVLVAMHESRQLPQPSRAQTSPESQWLAPMARFEDESGSQAAVWHAANQVKEAAMTVSDTAMTRLSRVLLTLTDPQPLIQRRWSNFFALEADLKHLLLPLNRPIGCAPFAFPIQLKEGQRESVLKSLHEQHLYAAVHWRELPSPVERFPVEHRLSRQLISLPCDHRYGAEDMSRIIRSVVQAIE